MEDLEKVYDDEISPLIVKIITICKEHDMPMFASFQYSDSDFCTTILASGPHHPVFDHYSAIKQSIEDNGVNIDKYLFGVLREAHKYGHSSLCLKQLGADEKPNDDNLLTGVK